MSIKGALRCDRHGDPVWTITVEGFHDIYRLSHNLIRCQVDIAKVGQSARTALRRKAGPKRWTWMLRTMHGTETAEANQGHLPILPGADKPQRRLRRPPWRTYVEREAVRVFAAAARKPSKLWVPAHVIEFERWYDCACPLTGRISQVMLRSDGRWHQAPLGDMPVVLEYLGTTV